MSRIPPGQAKNFEEALDALVDFDRESIDCPDIKLLCANKEIERVYNQARRDSMTIIFEIGDRMRKRLRGQT